ncbi:MAG: rhodanese-like domain-containing protein [Bacteroidota bacterium]
MHLRKMFYLFLIIPILFLNVACSEDDDPADPINEAQVLAEYLETTNFVTSVAPAMVGADVVEANRLDPNYNQYVIDIRTATDFAKGRIPGAVNVAFSDIVSHYETNNLATKDLVVIACYSGQTAGYATGILRLLGYANVKDLKWGMSSWHVDFAKWQTGKGNNYTAFVTDVTAKAAAGNLPKLETGKKTGADILKERVTTILADGFSPAATQTWSTVTANPSNYYIVNYWSADHYALGHIPGAIQYTPGATSDLTLATALKTLPTDKEIVVYCYTGQTSAHIAVYLRLLGYNAKSLLYGVNAMNYDWMVANGLTAFKDSYVMGYDYEKP